jgi:hypothetical protein
MRNLIIWLLGIFCIGCLAGITPKTMREWLYVELAFFLFWCFVGVAFFVRAAFRWFVR